MVQAKLAAIEEVFKNDCRLNGHVVTVIIECVGGVGLGVVLPSLGYVVRGEREVSAQFAGQGVVGVGSDLGVVDGLLI